MNTQSFSEGMNPHADESERLAFEDAQAMSLNEAEAILNGLASVFSPAGFTPGQAASEASEKRKKATIQAAELPNAVAKYRTLLEQIPAVVFMAFLDKGIGEAYVSPQIEGMLGFSQEEWLNDPVRWYQ